MMTVKDTAVVGPRQLVVTRPGSANLTINQALSVMPRMDGTSGVVPFMVGGSNVEKMGTVQPDIMNIGIQFTKNVSITTGNTAAIATAIQIVKLDAAGNPTGGNIAGTVDNPRDPAGNVVEQNVVLFKPSSSLDQNSSYRLTVANGADIGGQTTTMEYTVDFTTCQLDATNPSVVRMESHQDLMDKEQWYSYLVKL